VGKEKRGSSLSRWPSILFFRQYSSRNGTFYTIASNISIIANSEPVTNFSNQKFPTVTPIVAAAASASSVEIAGNVPTQDQELPHLAATQRSELVNENDPRVLHSEQISSPDQAYESALKVAFVKDSPELRSLASLLILACYSAEQINVISCTLL
jgi:hypothetical protein